MPKRKSPHKTLLEAARPFYELWLVAQGGGCALCRRPPSERRRLDIDHDHRMMHIRGLLCFRCNRALPSWMTPAWLRAAADYIEGGSTVHVGDYVELRKSHDSFRRGARGEVVRVNKEWATVSILDGGRFEAPIANLSRLVRAEYL